MKLAQIRSCIITAISVGVPVYNRGDPQGCYNVYAKAAQECLLISSTPTIRTVLSGAIEVCETQNEPTQQAWTMRRALDTVLSEVEVADGGGATPGTREPANNAQPAVAPSQSVDFTDASVAGAWTAVDDRIMGGSSRSRVVYDSGMTAFEGVLVEAGGGFASVRYGRPLSLPDVEALRLKVRVTDGREGYKLTLTGDHEPRVSYQCLIPASASERGATDEDGFAELELPLASFKPSFQGRPAPNAPPLRDGNLFALGLMLSQFAAGGGEVADASKCAPGEFRLELKRLWPAESELTANGRRWV
jgi:NADH dehydrogenase [ubiquinone] 1 alpha subcomplex assembly factor 1